jgi:transmembrane sensor
MNREDLIKKWLDHNLNPKEQTAFEALDDYNDLIRMSKSLEGFKAPSFDTSNQYNTIKTQLKPLQQPNGSWLKPLLRIAAILLICFSIYYYTDNLDTEIQTIASQQTTIDLPDASTVNLNALSTVTYSEKKWSINREVLLNGEAFFKVAKGSKFDVKTIEGVITVLGTQFNVKQRDNYFEVTCFEGLVSVTHNGTTTRLKPGHRFAYIDGKLITNEKENKSQPGWMLSESTFTSRPLKFVINELERQYNINIDDDAINVEQLFTGSFTHKDLDLALKSVTLPLSLTHTKTNTTIILKGE